MDESIERRMAERKAALVIKIIRGKTTVAEASWSFDVSPSEIEVWVEDAPKAHEVSRSAFNHSKDSTGNKHRYQACQRRKDNKSGQCSSRRNFIMSHIIETRAQGGLIRQ